MSMSRFLRECEVMSGSMFLVQYSANCYKKICPVGEGYGGRVVKAVNKQDADVVALKIIDLKRANYARAVQEVRNHNKLHHENIIRLRQVFVRSDRFVYLVLDYAELGDLQQFLLEKRGGILPENMAKYFFRQIVSGIKYMHGEGIVSRDIKLTNILVQTNKETEGQLPTIKLCDFGFSCDCKTSVAKSCVGTPDYVPPEVVTADGAEPYDGFKVDAWSCGVVLFNLVTGHQPFSGIKIGGKYDKLTIDCTINNVMEAQYSFPSGTHLSDDCISLIQGCLVKDPEQRMSVADILEHPWSKQNTAAQMTERPAAADRVLIPYS